MLFNFDKEPTTQFGLKFKPTLGSQELDDQDWIEYGMVDGKLTSMQWKHSAITQEFSNNNKKVLLDCINDLKSRNAFKSILEIGVFRSGEVSSTRTILENKPQETKYFGVDLNDGCLAPVRNHENNTFCLCTNSSNSVEIMNWVRSHGTEKFSIVHIDGWHSINQCLKDFFFAQYVEVGGYVVGHDVASHPGPYCLYEAIDEEYFEKQKFNTSPLEKDWGFFVARKLK